MRILLADDHELYRQTTKAMLEKVAGFTVVGEAATGRQAVRLFGELAPDMLIIDIVMPQTNGVEATQEIVNAYPDALIIGLSLHKDKHIVEAMIEQGASAYVLKESADTQLVPAIHAVAAGGTFFSPAIGLEL